MDAVALVTHAHEDVIAALDAAVIGAVDNIAEVRALENVLKELQSEFEFGRL